MIVETTVLAADHLDGVTDRASDVRDLPRNPPLGRRRPVDWSAAVFGGREHEVR